MSARKETPLIDAARKGDASMSYVKVLERRMQYGGRKGRSAKRRLDRIVADNEIVCRCPCGAGTITTSPRALRCHRHHRKIMKMLAEVTCTACGTQAAKFQLTLDR